VKVVKNVESVRRWSAQQPGTVGLVPTMGALHEGHLSLVRRARSENDQVAASVFVNPSQFGEGEDLGAYPRTLERDAELLEREGCDLVFAPNAGEMYPDGFQTWVEVGAVAEGKEGACRPGHFRGVATVVLKLLGIFQPTRAYFGEKDAQQLAVIRRMVLDLNVAVDVVGCATVREADGLAMSSRNAYLAPEERRAAAVLFRALSAAERLWSGGERRAAALREEMRRVVATEGLAELEYASVADPLSFAELDEAGAGALLSLAARVGRTRLIDNLRLADDSE